MNERWLIVADDLTGAADCAIAFARRGLRTRVLLYQEWFVEPETEVAAIDADSRGCSGTEAAARHARVLRRFGASDKSVFKKIDSTLRGHLAVEIAAMRAVLAEHQRSTFAVLAPAYPAMGRTTRDGRVLVHGKPLELSETWQREHAYPNADLGDVLATAGLASGKVPLSVVRAGTERLQEALRAIAEGRSRDGLGTIAICDAETDEDLDTIAGAARSSMVKGFLIGTAGLSQAVARMLPATVRRPTEMKPSNAGALVVVGSLASVSRQGAREVAAMSGVLYVRIEPATLLEVTRSAELSFACETAADALRDGVDVLIEIVAEGAVDLSRGPALAQSLAVALTKAMSRASGIIVTGGETAKALLTRHGVSDIELLAEIEAGVCLGLTHCDVPIPLITKSGAFGNAHSLVRALEKLRMIRISGQVA